MTGREGNGNGTLVLRRVSWALSLWALMSMGNAQAFEFLGIKLFEDQSDIDAEAVIADPQPYTATLTTSATGSLESTIRNASSLLAGQGAPASGAAGLLARARSDYGRILGALYNEGYYGGAISILVGGREAAKLPPDTRLPKPVEVQLKVDPGPLFHFGRIGIANQASTSVAGDDEVALPESISFAAGAVARSGVIVQAEGLATQAWQQLGYAEAKVVDRQVVADHATNTVDVTIVVQPGRQAVVGPIRVSGTDRMDPDFVAQQTGLVAGKEFDPDDIERAQKRLNRLDVFRAMRIEQAAGGIGADGVLPFNVLVEEQQQRRFGVGASYSSVDGLGLEAFHLWRNLFGRAERLRLDAKVAGINWPIDTAEFDHAFGGTFTKPGFLNPDNDLVAAISAERTVLPAYTQTSALASLGMTQYLDDVTLDGAAYYERSQFEDDFGQRDFSIVGLTAGAKWDARDNEQDAHEGFYLAATAEPFYELFYGYLAFKATAEARGYWSVMDNDQLVLAARAKIGALAGPDLDQIPPNRLFFAGGGGSVRGYAYRGIGVNNPDGTITGGRYLLEGSLEARYKVTNEIGAVAFLDGGYVAADTFPGIDQMRLGAGIGLRYYTSLGPLRLDLAVPLNKQEGDPDYALYVGIGQAF